FKRGKLVLVLVMLLVMTGGWGFLVHKTVHQLAIYALPKPLNQFFYRNIDYLVTNATRPDSRRNQDSTEATKHFIDLEMYGTDAANRMPVDWEPAVKLYTKDSLLKYGYVPYHVIYMKGKLTEAFRSGNKDSILFYAADLGHYIEDANVPLHTSVNYDGQLTNQKGLHSLWESVIPEIEIGNYNLYTPHAAKYLPHPELSIWEAVRRAAVLVPDMLQKEREVSRQFTDAQKFRVTLRRGRETKSYSSEFAKAYAAALKNTINEQLIHSANLVADFWYTSWADAGKPDLSAITGEWNKSDRKHLRSELKLFRQNRLIEKNGLLSKKTEVKESE
ncbi:MAG: hypothetical protein JWQ78_1304, partial [Sediminibacterium sp.]|nr:hypothetical protein [Sediminibacterium sp.]